MLPAGIFDSSRTRIRETATANAGRESGRAKHALSPYESPYSYAIIA